jgi:hypothetical protein
VRILLVFLASAVLGSSANAQSDANCVVDIRGNRVCGSLPGQCVLDRYRNAWCAPSGGIASKDRYDEVVCGAGACSTDRNGNIVCATAPGGGVSTAPSGELRCDGGCAAASKSFCRSMTN